MNLSKKPPRPLGLTLALIGSTLVFSATPLFVVGTLLYIQNRVNNPDKGTLIGINIVGMDSGPLVVYAGIAIFFLIMAAIAWRGRRSVMRFIFPLLNVIYGAIMLYAVSGYSPNPQQGIDSMTEFQTGISAFYVALIVGTVVYVCWFMNRWSSRAFYRGYYTPEERKLLAETYAYASGPAKK